MSEKPTVGQGRPGTLQQVIGILADAFAAYHAQIAGERLERLAIMIHRAMTDSARHYHTLEHVFKFLDPADPGQNLTALFHDLVYYQVDMGFKPEIWNTISPFVNDRGGRYFLAERLPAGDRLLWLTLELFELQPGQDISATPVLSEFLSALVMNQKLAGLVPENELCRMTVGIEATIPFRGRADGECYLDAVEARLRLIRDRHQLPVTDAEIEAALQWAVVFANTDIDSFAESDPARFLDGTWKLLPESNAALRSRETYSIRDFRQALHKMERFMSGLDPESVFSCFHGAPPPEVFEQLVARARHNILTAREYLRLKWLAMAVLEALAEATGGDAPLSLFLGDMPKADDKRLGLQDILPDVAVPPWVDPASSIYKLLAIGRMSKSSFDIENSPLALFIYKSVPPDRLEALLPPAQEMFAGRLSPEAFLARVDSPVVSVVARACAVMVYTRREKLLRFAS
jgi:hypothetical protein